MEHRPGSPRGPLQQTWAALPCFPVRKALDTTSSCLSFRPVSCPGHAPLVTSAHCRVPPPSLARSGQEFLRTTRQCGCGALPSLLSRVSGLQGGPSCLLLPPLSFPGVSRMNLWHTEFHGGVCCYEDLNCTPHSRPL